MSYQSYRLNRIIKIICFLAERPRSAEELIDILSQEPDLDWRPYSKETIWRDIRQLREAGLDIVHSRKSGRYELKSSPVRLEFEPEDLVALAVACRSISEKAGLPYAEEMTRIVEKISALLSPKSRRAFGDPHFRLRLEPVVDYGPYRDTIETLRCAIAGRHRVEMLYYSVHSDNEERRKVDPYDLYFSDGGVRLEGYCHLKRDVLEFRVDRIRRLKVLPGIFHSSCGGEDFEFKLWLDAKLTKAVGERFLDQKMEIQKDGSSILIARAHNPFRVILQVLSYGERAKVLSPEPLRERMAATVKAMAELYKV